MKTTSVLRQRASSLVTTLLVLTILTVIVLAFLQSMSLERKTAASYSNILKAQMAADAGVAEASTLLQQLFLTYPDSATAWVTNMAPTSVTNQLPGTAFFYYDQVSVTNTNTGATPTLYYRPLVSGMVQSNVAMTNRAAALAEQNNSSNYVNINGTNADGTPPWVGLPPSATNFPISVPWVVMNSGTNDSLPVSRYAFWIEDESFRVNLNTATNVSRGATSFGTNSSEISMRVAIDAAMSNSSISGQLATNVVDLRNGAAFDGTFRSFRDVNYANNTYSNLADRVGFLTTIFSSGLNQSRTGARRVNLNGIVATNTTPSMSDEIRDEVDRIVTAITMEAPQFGQRFYRLSATATNSPGVDETNAAIYLTKIAANIRDYIDDDSQPTIVMRSDRSIYAEKPTLPISADDFGGNEVMAIGKENVPRLQETFMHVTQSGMQGAGNPSHYSIRIAYYAEFWNMGTKDISVSDLGPNAFLRICNQCGWQDANSPTPLILEDPSRNYSIALSDFVDGNGNPLTVFRAGEMTVLSTETPPSGSKFIPDVRKVYRPRVPLSGPPHTYVSTTMLAPRSTGGFGNYATLVTIGRGYGNSSPGSPVTEDCWDDKTGIILGNDNGWLESHNQAVTIMPAIYVDSIGNNRKVNDSVHWRGGALLGNMNGGVTGVTGGSYQFGDPRANNEQLTFAETPSTSDMRQTRFDRWRVYQSALLQSYVPTDAMRSTMGAANTPFMNPASSGGQGKRWDEGANTRTTQALASGGSPSYYRNGRMQSIAELGHIYDPVRYVAGATDITRSVGGARSLRIGQSETNSAASGLVLWDGNPDSASRRWTAWRLLDIFAVDDDLQKPGLINPNGVLRDGGVAIRSALDGFVFSSSSALTDDSLKNKTISTNDINALVSSLTNQLARTNVPPFMERGELSELAFFNTNSLAGVDMTTVNDRGKEELFRRLAELITTKGNTFTVYVVGQALVKQANGTTKVTATANRRVTFRLVPEYASSDTVIDLENPRPRFEKPIKYAIQILAQSDQ